jgi:TrpR-related protein YerC/YecD
MTLYEAINKLETPEELKELLDDLCAPSEIHAMENRWNVAKMLSEGKTYQQIIDETQLSSAIVSRVKRVLDYGNGALKRMITN